MNKLKLSLQGLKYCHTFVSYLFSVETASVTDWCLSSQAYSVLVWVDRHEYMSPGSSASEKNTILSLEVLFYEDCELTSASHCNIR